MRDAALRITVLRLAKTLGQLAIAVKAGIRENHIGEGRELSRRLAQGRGTEHVVQHDAQVIPPLEARQGGSQPRVRLGGREAREILHQVFLGFQFGEIPVARELHR